MQILFGDIIYVKYICHIVKIILLNIKYICQL